MQCFWAPLIKYWFYCTPLCSLKRLKLVFHYCYFILTWSHFNQNVRYALQVYHFQFPGQDQNRNGLFWSYTLFFVHVWLKLHDLIDTKLCNAPSWTISSSFLCKWLALNMCQLGQPTYVDPSKPLHRFKLPRKDSNRIKNIPSLLPYLLVSWAHTFRHLHCRPPFSRSYQSVIAWRKVDNCNRLYMTADWIERINRKEIEIKADTSEKTLSLYARSYSSRVQSVSHRMQGSKIVLPKSYTFWILLVFRNSHVQR